MHKTVAQFTSLIVLLAAGSGTGLAQYGGGSMGSPGTTGVYTAPKGGYGGSGAAIGIGVGAAAGAGVAFWALHRRPNIVGCVQHSEHGNAVLSEKDGKLYQLTPDSDVVLKPGERVALKGKKTEEYSGKYSFYARKLIKDYGACEATRASAATTGGN
jgi:hypothetical protein